jgi:hypothetical protein
MIQRGLEFGDAPDYEILAGDCREVMATFDAESVDSIVSDPPYGLSAAKNSGKCGGFMGKSGITACPASSSGPRLCVSPSPVPICSRSAARGRITGWRVPSRMRGGRFVTA